MSYEFNGFVLPDETKDSIDRYVKHGIPTGGFLEACIENDLSEAVARADFKNMRALPAIVAYLYNECPCNCWGRAGVFGEWIDYHRAARREAEAAQRAIKEHQ